MFLMIDRRDEAGLTLTLCIDLMQNEIYIFDRDKAVIDINAGECASCSFLEMDKHAKVRQPSLAFCFIRSVSSRAPERARPSFTSLGDRSQDDVFGHVELCSDNLARASRNQLSFLQIGRRSS